MFFIFIGTSDKNLGKFISAKKNPILDPPPGTEVKSGTVNMWGEGGGIDSLIPLIDPALSNGVNQF